MWSTLLGDSAQTGLMVGTTYGQDLDSLDVVLERLEGWRTHGIWQRLLGFLEHPTLRTCQCEYQHRPAQKAGETIADLVLFKAQLTMDMPVGAFLQRMLYSHTR
jgi:hypothetical protein